ncbi:MAG: PIN domain-containing protein [Verrucomicrobia bacterium]|nr:PIN domain-containing protein [Verrucomicrobiota bacterium]
MARTVLADSGFLVALLSRDDQHHPWAVAQATRVPRPWLSCEAVVSESFHLLGRSGRQGLSELLQRGAVALRFDLADELDAVLGLMEKYAEVPMSLADGCLVRMTETLADPVLLTTDGDFRIYRRHSRQVIPLAMP